MDNYWFEEEEFEYEDLILSDDIDTFLELSPELIKADFVKFLSIASFHNSTNILKNLLHYASADDAYPFHILINCCSIIRITSIELFLTKISLTAKYKDNNILHMACKVNAMKLVEYLLGLSQIINTFTRNKNGHTPISILKDNASRKYTNKGQRVNTDRASACVKRIKEIESYPKILVCIC